MKPEPIVNDPAFYVMTMDILSNVLSNSDNPGEMGTYLTEEIRGLTGARCVLLIQYINTTFTREYRVISVNPERKREWAESPAVNQVYGAVHSMPVAQFWRGNELSDVTAFLQHEGFELSMAFPLNTGIFHVGAMLVLGLPDEKHHSSVLSLLSALSPIVALVLRNSILFEKQEQIIQERTEELQKSNRQLQIELAERRRMETELQDSYEYLQQLISSANVMIIGLDIHGYVKIFNKAAEEITGYSQEELSVIDWFEKIVPRDRYSLVWEVFHDYQQRTGEMPKTFENPILTKAGEERFISWQNSTISSPDKQISTISFGLDITDRIHAEEDLIKSEEKYRTIFEESFDGLYITSPEGKILDMNKKGISIFGYETKEEILSLDLEKDVYAYPSDRKQILSKVNMQGSAEYEVVVKKKNGEKMVTLCSLTAVKDETGVINSYRGIIRDITEQKQAEEELKKYHEHLEDLVLQRTSQLAVAKNQAEAANTAKSVFLSQMSHELRTPLNAILGYTQILKKNPRFTDAQQQQLEIIKSSGEQLLTLINDILDVCKFEAQRMELDEAPFNLPGLLRQVVSIAKIKANHKDLSLIYTGESALPEYVKGDAGKFRQILFNLLDNAIKYTNHGSVTLRAGYSQDGSGMLTFIIIDTGIGIPKDKQKVIFEPFSHLDAGGKKYEGVGLGLAIVKQLVGLMGGKLELESEPDKGSEFRIIVRLPAIKEEIEYKKPSPFITGYEGERKKILVVDDNATNALLLVSLFEPLGFRVFTANSGEEAVTKALLYMPDLVILDLVMPDMDGVETGKALRELPDRRNQKIIGVSAALSDNGRINEFKDICNDFLPKPVDNDLLLEKIQDQLEICWIMAPLQSPEIVKQEETQLPLKVPPAEVLTEIKQVVRHGQFGTPLNEILTDLQVLDPAYLVFIYQIRQYAEEFDDEGILSYIDRVSGRIP